ncbi:MAG: efflux RND transporter periplasmic adaptor subunit [bacterium]
MKAMNEKFAKLVKRTWRPVVGLIGLVVLILWTSGAWDKKTGPGKVESLPGVPLPEGVNSLVAKATLSASPIEVVGSVVPEAPVNLSARFPATIQSMRVAAGDGVTNGQVLATLDDRDIREQLAAVESQFRQAETEYNRTLGLFEKGAATDQMRVAALSGFESARARLKQVLVMLSYAVVVSPLDGIVTDRRMEAGDLAAPGQVLMTVYDPRRMRVDIPVPVRLLPRFALGQTLEVTLDGVSGTIKGTMQEIVAEVDPSSRTRKVKIRLDAGAAQILPGTYVRVVVDGDSHQSVRVPATAIVRIGQQEFIQVVAEGRVIRRVVRTGVAQGDQIEVLSGLADGEVIVPEPVKED